MRALTIHFVNEEEITFAGEHLQLHCLLITLNRFNVARVQQFNETIRHHPTNVGIVGIVLNEVSQFVEVGMVNRQIACPSTTTSNALCYTLHRVNVGLEDWHNTAAGATSGNAAATRTNVTKIGRGAKAVLRQHSSVQ